MTGRITILGSFWLCVLLVLATATLGQAQGQKAGIGFKNLTSDPVLVQGKTYVNGMYWPGKQLVIFPNKTAWDTNVVPGNRIVCVYDANQPNRKLAERTIPFFGRDVFCTINVDPAGKVRIQVD